MKVSRDFFKASRDLLKKSRGFLKESAEKRSRDGMEFGKGDESKKVREREKNE